MQPWQPTPQFLLRTGQSCLRSSVLRTRDQFAEIRRSGWGDPDVREPFVPENSLQGPEPEVGTWIQRVCNALDRMPEAMDRLRKLRGLLNSQHIVPAEFVIKWWLLVTVATNDVPPRTVLLLVPLRSYVLGPL